MDTLLELMAAQRRDYMELVRTQCHELVLAQLAQRRRDRECDIATSSSGPGRVGAADGQGTGVVNAVKAKLQDTEDKDLHDTIEAKMVGLECGEATGAAQRRVDHQKK